jgi:hypothetical protein
MRRTCDRWLGLFILISGLLTAPAWGSTLTVKDLLDKSDHYHQQAVSVVGEASELTTRSGPRNQPFYTFALKYGGGSVTVVMQGKPELANGDQVLVHGVFFKSRKAGRTTVTNRIEATVVQQLHDNRLPLVG